MPAKVVRLRTKADRLRRHEADQLRQMVLEFAANRRDVSNRAVGEIIASIDRETTSSSGWTFVMVSPAANVAIVQWLAANSSRPQVAMQLWAMLFMHIRHDTCEIVQTRDELAQAVGIAPRHVSEIMSELESIGAISRKREGRGVRYFMNPRVGSHLTGAMRMKAQASAPPLKLALVPSD